MLQISTTMIGAENTVTITDSQAEKAVQEAITAIRKELPEEALTHGIFKYITEKIMEKVETSKIVL